MALDIGKKVRHTLRPGHDELLDKRPRPVEEDEEISTLTCKEVEKEEPSSRTQQVAPRATPTGTNGTAKNIDPDASLIADFQIITDLRVSLYMYIIYVQ